MALLSCATVLLFSLISSCSGAAIYDKSVFSRGDDAAYRTCKPIAGSADWPHKNDWTSLNKSLNGALLAPLPPAIVCDSSHGGNIGSAACSKVNASWFNTSLHSSDPVSVDWPNWQNDSCLPPVLNNNTDVPCNLQQFPHYVVNASSATQVQEAIKFAVKTRVRTIVKGTGHDFLGRSTSPSALSIWTHHLRGLDVKPNFTPKGCKNPKSTPAVTIAAGNQFRDIYGGLEKHNLTLVGGADPNVGIGGWLTGGGHSPISGKFGLGVDNTLEMEVVTPTGEFVTVNDCQNQDLFWAMKGGGGSTFGVLISTTQKTIPDFPLAITSFTANSTKSEAHDNENKNYFDLIAGIYGLLPELSDAGFQGYFFLGPLLNSSKDSSSGSPYTSSSGNGVASDPHPQQRFTALGFWPNDSAEDVSKKIADLQKLFNATSSDKVKTSAEVFPVPSWNAAREALLQEGAAGVNAILTSRLWDEEAVKDKAGLAKTFTVFEATQLQGLVVSGPGVRSVDKDSSAVNPAWRKTFVHSIYPATSPLHFSPAEQKAIVEKTTYYYGAALRKQAPNSGSYFNECDLNEPDFQHAFLGDHYGRLLEIKRKVDPHDVFWCKVCVSSEGWKEDDLGNVCKVHGV